MTQAAETSVQASDTTTSVHPLIESNRVEGTPVYSPHGKHVGTIHHLIIEKVSGRVVYAVMSFGGFLGIGSSRAHDPMGETQVRHPAWRLPHRHHARGTHRRSRGLRG